MLLNFDESFKTGISDIDIQHEYLFDSINKLEILDISKDRKSLWFVICTIEAYATLHFETEEEYMNKLNYPEMEEHVMHHRDFSEKYKSLKQSIDEENLKEYVVKLKIFLNDWLVKHYTDIDLKMISFIKKGSAR